MPCYTFKSRPASRKEFEIWKGIGFNASYKKYKEIKSREPIGTIFVCGDLGEHCADCSDLGTLLCDYPVGDGKTCDRPMCEEHAHEIGHELHYCEAHNKMWEAFKESGGVDAALKNVIAFKPEK